MNIKLKPNEWVTKLIPLFVVKHRLLVTDPTYKFVINAVISARSNLSVRRDSDDNDYYDILNMSVVQDTITSPTHWVSFINKTFNINLIIGTSYQSNNFPELFFENIESQEIFDSIYTSIQQNNFLSDGVNFIIDFNIKLSGGFIRNKIGIDTSKVKNWILSGLSFSVLDMIMEKDANTENYKIKDNFKDVYSLSSLDIELIESIFIKYNSVYPSNNDVNIFWDYLDRYKDLTTLLSKQNLFDFRFNGAIVSEVNSKYVSFVLNQYNRPSYIQTQMKFDSERQRVYLTRSGPSNPVSEEIGFPRNSVLKRSEVPSPSKSINTKINPHIYMVNKK